MADARDAYTETVGEGNCKMVLYDKLPPSPLANLYFDRLVPLISRLRWGRRVMAMHCRENTMQANKLRYSDDGIQHVCHGATESYAVSESSRNDDCLNSKHCHGWKQGISSDYVLGAVEYLTGRVLEVILGVEDMNHFLVLSLDHAALNVCQQVSNEIQQKEDCCHLPRLSA